MAKENKWALRWISLGVLLFLTAGTGWSVGRKGVMASSYGMFQDCTPISGVLGVTCTSSSSSGKDTAYVFDFDFSTLSGGSSLAFTVDFPSTPTFAKFDDTDPPPSPPFYGIVIGCG